MTDIRLDELTHDIWFEDGLIDTVEELAELEQALKIAFLTGLGEYAFDTSAGVGYRQVVFVKPVDETKIRGELTRVALARDGVTAVLEIVIDTDEVTRHSTITVSLDTIYGDASVVF